MARATALSLPEFLFRVMLERIAPDERLDELMNTRVKPALEVIPPRVEFHTTSPQVFAALYSDFMKPVTSIGTVGGRGSHCAYSPAAVA